MLRVNILDTLQETYREYTTHKLDWFIAMFDLVRALLIGISLTSPSDP